MEISGTIPCISRKHDCMMSDQILTLSDHFQYTRILYPYIWKSYCKHWCICIVGMVDGCGCDGLLKYTICNVCRLCHLILSILKPVYRQLQQIRCTYESPRCLDLKIWQFFVDDDDMTNYFTPCAYVQGNECESLSNLSNLYILYN